MLQYLKFSKTTDNESSFKEYMYFKEKVPEIAKGAGDGYKIKKFAYKLKQIVALLIGCTVEQLEDREFKEKELGEEWWYWSMSWVEYSRLFSDQERFNKIFKSQEAAESYLDGNLDVDQDSVLINQTKLTPRKLLQLLGTEAGREIIHPNIWVNALFANYKDVIPQNANGNVAFKTKPNWIITDCRFHNEAQAVKDKGGIVIRVNRPGEATGIDGFRIVRNPVFDGQEHPSETALDDYKDFDHVIENDGSLEDLFNKVKEIYG